MSPLFPLDGLLRLRRLQEDQAAAEVAFARRRLGDTTGRQRAARESLGLTSVTADDVATFHSIAAARASSASMLADLVSVETEQARDVEIARLRHMEAHARALAMEKLEARHDEAQLLDELRTEQVALDEISARTTRTDTDGSTR